MDVTYEMVEAALREVGRLAQQQPFMSDEERMRLVISKAVEVAERDQPGPEPANEVRQVDPVGNPDYVIGPNDEVPRLATERERQILGLAKLGPATDTRRYVMVERPSAPVDTPREIVARMDRLERAILQVGSMAGIGDLGVDVIERTLTS